MDLHKRKIIWFAVLSVISVGIVGAIRQEPYSSRLMKESFWARKTFPDKKYSMVIFGDSRVYRGVDPTLLEVVLPQFDAYNFAYSSAGLSNDMLEVLDGYIDYKASEKLVVIGLTPNSLTDEAMKNEHYHNVLELNWYEVFKRKNVNQRIEFFEPIDIRQLINGVEKGRYAYYEKFRAKGWVESDKIPFDSTSALVSYKRNFKNNPVKIKYLTYLIEKITYWNQRGIKVIVFCPPTTTGMVGVEDGIGKFDEVVVKSKIIGAGGIWLDFRHRFYGSYDGSHLGSESAKRFSNDLGQEIKKVLINSLN